MGRPVVPGLVPVSPPSRLRGVTEGAAIGSGVPVEGVSGTESRSGLAAAARLPGTGGRAGGARGPHPLWIRTIGAPGGPCPPETGPEGRVLHREWWYRHVMCNWVAISPLSMACRRLVRPVCPEREKEGALRDGRPPAADRRRRGPAPLRRRRLPPFAPAARHPADRRERGTCRSVVAAAVAGPRVARRPTGGPGDPRRFLVAAISLALQRAGARPGSMSGAPAPPSSPLIAGTAVARRPTGGPGGPPRFVVAVLPPGTPAARRPASRRERGTCHAVVAPSPGGRRGGGGEGILRTSCAGARDAAE